MAKKTTQSAGINRESFRNGTAISAKLVIGEQTIELMPMEFGTGTLGWSLNKTVVRIDGAVVTCAGNIFINKSKDM